MNKNALYCGMADDIGAPFRLHLDFDTLYVMDMFDPAYSTDNTLEGQKKDILYQLEHGCKKPDEFFDYLQNKYKKINKSTLSLLEQYTSQFESCEILGESTEKNKWSIEIKHQDKKKNIIIFHQTNFCNPWPEEIKHIDHIMSFGAVFPLSNNICLQEMISSRCSDSCLFYFKPYNLDSNKHATKAFSQLEYIDIFTCNIKTHMPLLQYIFVDEQNKNNVFKIPQNLVNSYVNKESKILRL